MWCQAIKKFKAEVKTLSLIQLSWETEPYNLNAAYTVYRAAAQGSPFELVGNGIGNAFIDEISPYQQRDGLVYRVNVAGKEATTHIGGQADSWLLAIAGEYMWQLNNIGNATIASIYCVNHEGGYCPECYSVELGKRIKTSCSTCDGSGRITSYLGPLPLRYAIIDNERTQSNMGVIESEIDTISAWTGNIPFINIGDIIITQELVKYKVQSIPKRTIMHSIIDNREFIAKQWLVLRKLNDDEYPMLSYVATGTS